MATASSSSRARTARWAAVVVGLVLLVGGAVAAGSGSAGPSPAPSTLAVVGSSPSESPPATPWAGPPGGWPPQSIPPTAVVVASPAPTPKPTRKPDIAKGPTRRVATRVTVPQLDIDLPVMRQKTSYPPCNVAMYLPRFEQPGRGGPTYLYAHARTRMFLPLLTQSKRRDGKAMIGMQVFVYTGDNLRFEYVITRVRRHARDFRPVVAAKGETIWLQTSEGPNASYPKLQVAGRLVGSVEVSHDEAHPRPRPKSC